MTILLILFFVFLVYNSKVCYINKYTETPFDKKISASLFGIATIMLLLNQISTTITDVNPTFTTFFGANIIGDLGIGIFFFISGFGLLYNHKNNPKYLKSVLTKSIPALYFMYVLTNALYIIYFVCIGKTFTVSQIFSNLFGIAFLNNFEVINVNAWFIPTLLCLYFAFFIIYYLGNKVKLNNELCSILLVIFVVCFYILNHFLPYDIIYTKSIFCFVVGITYAMYFDRLNKFFRKHYLWCLFVIATIFFLNQFLFTIIDKNQTSAACLICFLVLLLQKVEFGNLILSTVKRVGLEIYLMQYMFCILFKDTIHLLSKSKNWYAIVVLFTTIISATILHLIIKYIRKGILKLHKYIKSKKQEPLIG